MADAQNTKKPKGKDYNRLVTTIIEESCRARFEMRVLDTIVYGGEGFPFLMLKSESRAAKYTAVVVSGSHGDEPQGVDSLIHALGDLDTTLWNYYIFPVMNPFGWKYESRLNGNKAGVNWKVGKRDTPELSLLFRHLPNKISLAIDVHGDKDETRAYIYERKLPNYDSLARLILTDVKSYFDIRTTKTVYKEPNTEGVVVSGREGTVEEYLFEQKGAIYSLTLEVPGRVSGTGVNQIAGGARMIVSALSNFERARGLGVKPIPEKKVEEKPKDIIQEQLQQKQEEQA